MIRIFPIDGKLRAEISPDYPFETPIKFQVIHRYTNQIEWECELHKGHWSEYNYPDSSHPTAKLISKSGEILIQYNWNTMVDGDDIHKIFLTWAKNNVGKKGIAIGTHDGTSGEWVEPVRNGILNGYLVEASIEQYKNLVDNYRSFKNVYTLMHLVTTDGSYYNFYEGDNGYTNSIIESITNQYQSSVISKKMPSISLNDLIVNLNLQNDLSWLHIDVEGIDADLIMSLDESRIKLPEIIIFETVNLPEYKIEECVDWLSLRGYKVSQTIGFNRVAYK